MSPTDEPGIAASLRRIRDALEMRRGRPSEPLDAEDLEHTRSLILDLASRTHHLAVLHDERIQDVVAAIADLVEELRTPDPLHDALVELRSTLERLEELQLAPERDRRLAAALAELGPTPARVDGISLLVDASGGGDVDELLASWGSRPCVVVHLQADEAPVGCESIALTGDIGRSRARNLLLAACRTRHGVVVAPGDRIDPSAVELAVQVARTTAATVVEAAAADTAGQGPVGGGRIRSDVHSPTDPVEDRLAVLDVAAVCSGPLPLTGSLLESVSASGGLTVFVPVMIGHRSEASRTPVPAPPKPPGEIQPPAPPYEGDEAIAVVHPATGPLWASHAATGQRPALSTSLSSAVFFSAVVPVQPPIAPPQRSVLVVSAGGGRRVGDDADTRAAVHAIRSALPPDIAIEIVSEGARPGPGWDPGVWLCTRREVACRPLRRHAALVIVGGELSDRAPEAFAGRALFAEEMRSHGAPVLAMGVSVGEFSDAAGLEDVTGFFRSLRGLAVVDQESAARARSFGAGEATVLGHCARVDRDRSWPVGTENGHVVFQPFTRPPLNGEPRLSPTDSGTLDLATAKERAALVDVHAATHRLEVVALAQSPDEVAPLLEIAEASSAAPWRVVDSTDSVETTWSHLDSAAAVFCADSHVASWSAELDTPVADLGAPLAGAHESETVFGGPRRAASAPPGDVVEWLHDHLATISPLAHDPHAQAPDG